jgi:hypothetical protein
VVDAELDAYHRLCAYTLTHGDAAFIHQHVVDAFAAQRADAHSKPIGVTFALVGLYLHVDRRFSGRRVQQAHMQLARRKRPWPVFALPAHRGAITAAHVIEASEGPQRDEAIDAWCASVWEACAGCRPAIADLLHQYGIVGRE